MKTPTCSADQALIESQQRLERLTNTVPVMLYDSVMGPDGASRFLYVAPEPCREILELDPDDLLRDMSLVWALVHPEDLDRFSRDDLAANRSGQVFSSELRIITPSGRLKWLLVNSKPNPAAPGELVVWSGYLQDITPRKQAEEKLRETEQKLRLIVEHSTNLFYIHSTDHVFSYVSPQSQQFFGCSPEELMVHWTDLLTDHPLNRQAIERTQLAIDTGRRQPPYQVECIGKQGRKIWVEVNEAPILEQGRVVAIAGSLTDLTERKQAEKEREQYVNFFRTSGDLMCIADPHGNFLKTNPAFSATLGYSTTELTAKPLIEFIHPDDRQATLKEIARQQQLGYTENFENRYLCKDGSVKWLSWRVNLDQTEGIAYANARDITAQKRSDEELRSSRNLLHTVMENVPTHVFWKDTRSHYLGCNTAFARAAGFKRPEDLLGKDDFQMCWGEQAELYRADDKRVMDSGLPVIGIEEPQTTPDGRTILIRTSKVPLFSAEGKVVGMLGIFEDITEQRQAEESLRDREAQLRIIFETSQAGIILVDPSGTIQFANKSMAEMFGTPLDDLIGCPYPTLLHPEERLAGAELMGQLIRGDIQSVAVERHYIRSDGRDFWGFLSGKRLVNPDGSLQALVGIIADITEQKRLQEQLSQAQKIESVGRLAGGVAHDFNNMLSVILGHVEMAQRKIDVTPPLREHLAQIQTAAERSTDIVRQLLAFARKQTVSPRLLDLTETIQDMLKMLRRLIGEEIELVWKAESNLWPVRMDPAQVDQILANLCVNARDAIAGYGRITIELRNTSCDQDYCRQFTGLAPGDYIQLIVSDNGCGMDREILEDIFEPFFTTKELGQGTGLGLATVYGIVKQNAGYIDVASEPGQGASFTIYLPRGAGNPVKDRTAAAPPVVKRGQETVLLVEDEPAILDVAQQMLEMQGYQVLIAATPKEAIRLAEKHSGEIHLLLTDVVMPEMNGRQLAEKLLPLYPDLRRLYMSGYTANVIAHHGVLDETVHFIQKPFTLNALATKVRQTLD